MLSFILMAINELICYIRRMHLHTIKWTCFCVLSVIEAKVQALLLQQSSLVYSQAILGVLCSLPTLKNKNNQHTRTHTHTHTHTRTLYIPVSEWSHTTAGNRNKLRTSGGGGGGGGGGGRGVETLIAALVLGLKSKQMGPQSSPKCSGWPNVSDPMRLRTPDGMSGPGKEWCPDTLVPTCTMHRAAKSAQEKSDIPVP